MINEWFNHYSIGLNPCDPVAPSPRETVARMCHYFSQDVKLKGLELCVSPEHFMKIMFEGMCTLYDQHVNHQMQNLSLSNYSQFHYPPGWNQDVESIWVDYLNTRIFGMEYWDAFWDYFKECEWESDVHCWRAEFQALMPLYVTRSIALLVTEGLVTFADDTTPESSEDEHESHSHDEYYKK